MIELTCHRHVNWSPFGEKAYNDYDVDDFLRLCGVADTHLITGHTPISRETGWEWPMGPRNTVIFAAGRELGYARVDAHGLEFVRVGRSQVDNDDKVLWDRTPVPLQLPSGQVLEVSGGRRAVRINDPSQPVELWPDVLYRFDYPGAAVTIQLNEFESVSLRHYRHLSPGSQAYYPLGYYLVGNEPRQEVLKLKRDQSLVLRGGHSLCLGVRFSLPHLGEREALLLSQGEDGQFEVRALIEGLRLV